MAYIVYVKDKGSRGRFEQWSRKKHSSKTKAVMEAQEVKYKASKKPTVFGKPKVEVRKVGNGSSRRRGGIFG